jgi:hypothetical protein
MNTLHPPKYGDELRELRLGKPLLPLRSEVSEGWK